LLHDPTGCFWISVSLLGLLAATPAFTRGIIFGGLIVTINFHLLARTLNKALRPQQVGFPQRDPGLNITSVSSSAA
jgi:hypothetical protein